ncbi:3-hydroxyacyl-CoA dehydrogenase/enoyl-CoA hydratase family protein [Paenibacillus contaminans]|uniref:3-hydroxyacyl-CoA dehydrogenase n=1 Tax=Paenibacillus contaminans TaxID=450362 RepID=A0A329MM85_9BACL|nr:3-hydroxyacyl-CoA dehydrogenase/enoyl-CoA hydratase family protein [Paenibacillus contaminans]RAV20638.1 3-hydroxyacyl-CoA dehydrogenase [Paenibacillus contaminans]
MKPTIRKAVVLGAGVMGAQIAANLAGAGVDVYLLDRLADDSPEREAGSAQRSRLAQAGKLQLLKQKPLPYYDADDLERIATGNFTDHLHAAGEADWIIEAVSERLDVKLALFAKLAQHVKAGTIISSNTSGLSINRLAETLPSSVQPYFLGAHFFNPPRYMKLLELIPSASTSKETIKRLADFAERRLGKGIVIAKDSPNFIANRIGTYGIMVTLEEMTARDLSVSAVDALTGTAIGRPKSATFRTLDIVGLDTFAHVASNMYDHAIDDEEREIFAVPELFNALIQRNWLGEKSGQGFYKAIQGVTGSKEILQLDAGTMNYVTKDKKRFPCLDTARNGKTPEEKLAAMTSGLDPGSAFVWSVLKRTLLYAASVMPVIADDLVSVDDAMRWGFNWEWGPFELWDKLGFVKTALRMKAEGERLPDWIERRLADGMSSFYERGTYVGDDGERKPRSVPQAHIQLSVLKGQDKRIIRQNYGASLIDIGDDVACLELHSPNNAVGPDILQMVSHSIAETERNYRGLVIASEGKHFCVGANLMLLLMEAQDDNWTEIERMIASFQQAGMAIKYSARPVVSAPYGMTLGGGVELSIPAARVQASAETYMGLVEAGVGLIPAGGGTKEMLVRATAAVDFDGKVDLQPFVNRVFETIGLAKVSTSAADAKRIGYLRPNDNISFSRDRQLYEAKRTVLALDAEEYVPPSTRRTRVVGAPGLSALKLGVYQMRCGGMISEHDALIGTKLAHILSGGEVPAGTLVDETYLLELEREAFLSLCGEPKSQARMQHMLLKGKPLRN